MCAKAIATYAARLWYSNPTSLLPSAPNDSQTFLQRFACFIGQIIGFVVSFILYSQYVVLAPPPAPTFDVTAAAHTHTLPSYLQILERFFARVFWRHLQNWTAWSLPDVAPVTRPLSASLWEHCSNNKNKAFRSFVSRLHFSFKLSTKKLTSFN